ncbi:hypothetical protein QCN35_gp76 [Arthrobacter phage Synepsis]|uniref:Uncharacterized protein n=1 Tax=Arthrobacter phage Synepsis TaxID=2250389 RepID=A0A345KUN5_9CAUD|nr:hypothetical protein QCN35_gp76 [Arthrobacter phage Synepsis]AXH46737.1 hypothetical protein SEA_SYNEPSIS_76 [Arthrobacter phage Synepsis]
MIITRFEHVRSFGPAAVVDMPHPVRVGEYVELSGESFNIVGVHWVIEPGKPIELVARIREV